MPGPQYMQPPPMVEAHMQTQLAPNNIGRGSRIRKRPSVDQVVQERTIVGQKPYTLRVKAGGEIAGALEEKTVLNDYATMTKTVHNDSFSVVFQSLWTVLVVVA
jgi:hypothetical protein